MYCPQCGQQNADSSMSCSSCGTSLSVRPDPRVGMRADHFGEPAPTKLVQSILVTIFCCQIFGIVAIVFSAIAMGKNSSGDYAGARDAAKKANMWGWIGFGVGLMVIIGYVGLMVIGAAAGAAGSGNYP
jgi:heme A synthase